jgi:methyl-accepting chemotaxis protein
MSEDVFRWVITAAVILACIAFLVQAAVAVALFKVARSMREKVTPLLDRATPILDTGRKILEENKPRIAEISADAAETARTVKQQAQRLGVLVSDVADRTQQRVEQIDKKVDQTVDQLGEVGDTVKGAMLKPVREVNGILNGFRAAIAAYAQGSRRHVDRVTQDEEMFI